MHGSALELEVAASLNTALDFVWLEITNQCNLVCHHCYAESGPHQSSTGTMGFDDWCAVMDEARELGCCAVQFIGGEPTVHPRFIELVAAAHAKGFRVIEIYTNGMRLTPSLCEQLKGFGATIAVSFYAADPNIHDQITGRRGSFDRTIRGISEAVRQGLTVRAGVIGMAINDNELAAAAEYVAALGVTSVKIDYERSIGRAATDDRSSDPMQQLCGACGSGRIAVNALGEVSPCVFSHFCNLGHFSEGISAIVGRSDLATFAEELRLAKTGASCSPDCSPNKCSPGCNPNGSSCFPKSCDPSMCNPINCTPRD